jgi:hypothetical protein
MGALAMHMIQYFASFVPPIRRGFKPFLYYLCKLILAEGLLVEHKFVRRCRWRYFSHL